MPLFSLLCTLALTGAGALAQQTQILFATNDIVLDTGSNTNLTWRVNIFNGSYNQGDDETFPPIVNGHYVNVTQELIWPGNQTLDDVLAEIWTDVSPSSPPKNFTVVDYLTHWIPVNISSHFTPSPSGDCSSVLGAECVASLLASNSSAVRDAYSGSAACNATLNGIPDLFYRPVDVDDPPFETNSNFSDSFSSPLLLDETMWGGSYNGTNLTALEAASGQLHILLLPSLPRPVLACQIVNASESALDAPPVYSTTAPAVMPTSTKAKNFAAATAAPKVGLVGALGIGAVLAVL